MSSSTSMRLSVLLFLATGTHAVCAAQTYTPPPPPLTTLPPCPVPKDEKEAREIAKRKDCDPTNRPLPSAPKPAPTAADSAARKFPYPGEEAAQPAKPADTPAAKAFPFPGDATPASAPAESAAKRFPYPGDSTAPSPALGPSPPSAESSSSSSSATNDAAPASAESPSKAAASDDDDDGRPQLVDKGSEGKRNRKTVTPQTDDDRVDEDLSIAKFYGQSGNPMGAYLRAKDAVKTEPDLPEARFVMGEAAKRLNKKDEAKAEFSEYLKLAPDGEHAKAAEKALAELR